MKARALIVVLVCALSACARAPESETSAETSAQPMQSEATRFLLEVESTRNAAGADARGIEMLRTLADRTEPRGLTPADFAAVRRDLYLEAAQRAVQTFARDDAQDILRAGLAVEGHDPFRVQLYLLAASVAGSLGDKVAQERAFEDARAELDLLQ